MVDGVHNLSCTPYEIKCLTCPTGYNSYTGSAQYCERHHGYSECSGDDWEKQGSNCHNKNCNN